jgi:ABC-type dipeptide/oligopeptide/nickel transport system permease subunit
MSFGQGPSSDVVEAAEVVNLTTDEGRLPPLPDTKVRPGRSPSQIAFERLRADKVAVICFGVVVFFVLVAVFAPVLASLSGNPSPTKLDSDLVDAFGFPTIGFNSHHWFGVEPRLGRDLFARWVYGARPSLIVSFTAGIIATIIGTVAGLVSGFLGGVVDRVISWVVDFFLALPFLVFVLAAVPIATAWFGNPDNMTAEKVSSVRMWILIAVFALLGWAGLARLVRGEVLSLREREFVQAARAIGVPTGRILFKEILPSLSGVIIVFLSITIPGLVSAEAGLSLLGAGMIEPTASWGRTIASAQTYFSVDPLYMIMPMLAVTALVLSLSLFGDAVRDAFDPNTRR